MKRNLKEAFGTFDAHWTPKILSGVGDCHIKLFKAKGEFVWHKHDQEEFFLVIQGKLKIAFRDREEVLTAGECLTVPPGVEHMPHAEDTCCVLLVEPKETVNTGDATSEKRVESPDWI